MSIFYRITALLGGLGMFLYGMQIMGNGLKSTSGTAMKSALAKVTNKPVKGFLLGLLVTCMIQSSHATIVLTVGLVGAGFLTFQQSIGVILGANVGTAITAQIIRLMDLSAGSSSILYFFKADNLAQLSIIAGIILIMFINKRSSNAAGTILMGFGLLFVGIINMSNSVSSMGNALSHFLVAFENNYFLGFLSGFAVTSLIQSSSAAVGILQSIASSVGMKFCAAVPVIIGINIADSLTAYLVCRIGAKPVQIRTVLVHVIYNVFAATLLIVGISVLRLTGVLNDSLWYTSLRSGGIANLHGLFRLIPAITLLPFVNVFAKLATRIVPDKETDETKEDAEIEKNLRELDAHLITNPGLALEESSHLISHMADVASHNFEAAMQQLDSFDAARYERISERENLLDRMADASDQYLISISPYISLEKDHRNQSFQLRALIAFERIGDLDVNISDHIHSMTDADKEFSKLALRELTVVSNAIREILSISLDAYKNDDYKMAEKIEPLEEVIDELCDTLRSRHMYRMTHHQCDISSGVEFQNILLNIERISDQCSDLGVYMLGRRNDSILGNEHKYLHDLHHSQETPFQTEFHAYKKRYFNLLPETTSNDKID